MSERGALESLVEALLTDQRDTLAEYFTARGARLEALEWSPDSTVSDTQQISFLIEYWKNLCGDADLPAADRVSPFDLRPALGHIVLIDMVDDGWDGQFRLYGTKVAETYGRDMTGRRVSDIDGGNYISVFFRALYRAACLRRAALYTLHVPPPHVAVESWQRIMLPLSGSDGRVTRFLVSNIAGAWRPPGAVTRPSAALFTRA